MNRSLTGRQLSRIVRLSRSGKGAHRKAPAVRDARRKTTSFRDARSVSVRASTFDPKTLRFQFVLASETPCRTYRIGRRWELLEVEEVLPMAGLEGLKGFKGCPLLDTHNARSVRNVLGRIDGLAIEGTEVVGSAFLSDRPDVAGIARDLETGVLQDFSVGFEILEDGEIEEREGLVPLVRVKRWKIFEGSMVPLPADHTATMRAARRRALNSTFLSGARAMTPAELEKLLTSTFASATRSIVDALTVDDDADDVEGDEDDEVGAEAAAEAARAAYLADKRSKQGQGDKAPKAPAKTGRSADEELKVKGLRKICKARGLEKEFDALDASGATLEELRGVLNSALRTSNVEIDTTVRPASEAPRGGNRSGKLMVFAESEIGKQVAK